MFVLGSEWSDGYLDYHKGEDELRIDVRVLATLEPVEDQYFVRPRDPRLVWNYLRRVGPRAVFEKLRSRLGESERNAKFLSVGLGVVREPAALSSTAVGTPVVFLLYNHPRGVDRVVVDRRFVRERPGTESGSTGVVRWLDGAGLASRSALEAFAGWSRFAGVAPDKSAIDAALDAAAGELEALSGAEPGLRELTVPADRPVMESTPVADSATGQLSAALFGLGNYAKVCILPNVDRGIRVVKIHEIDPLQIGRISRWDCALDTGEGPRDDEKFDVYFIAGYHHTHAPIAIDALERGAYAVVEKPLVTTREQLEALEQAWPADSPSRIFGCFHKRYSAMNAWARKDLKLGEGDAVHYRCIVYEVPLPRRHWYNWPHSGSRLVSNGCHWIDHFMYLNGFAEVTRSDVGEAANGDVSVQLELANGACFTMTLTDHGSGRLGVRDYIELARNDVTVRMIDSARYEAEDGRRMLRRASVNPMDGYRIMYRRISRQIAARETGDPRVSLRSARAVIELEETLQQTAALRSGA